MNSPVAVLFGAGGQLGSELKRVFGQRGYAVTGFERSQLDVSDAAAVEKCLTGIDPAVVLNAAAYNKVDLAETEPMEAFKANALAVANLAKNCRQIDARLVHFSTDYVFDGMAGRAYVESDAPHPLGAYAVSKLGGELYAQAYLDEPLVIRVSGVFGVASPTYTLALAERTADLIERKAHGVYHVGGGRAISWFDFAKLIFDAAGLKPELLATNERTYRTPARRPKYSALRNARLENEQYPEMPRLEAAIEEYLKLSAAMRP